MKKGGDERLVIITRASNEVPHAGTILLIVDPDSEDELNYNFIIQVERMNSSGMTLLMCSPDIEEIKTKTEGIKREKEQLVGAISGNDLQEEIKLFFKKSNIPVQIFKPEQ